MSGSKTYSEESKDNVKSILNNYAQNEKSIVDQLHFANVHGPIIGRFREDIWKSMFEQLIPRKFVIEQSVFIIDSYGNISKEIDLAIFDEMYTPYIFRYGKIKFIPIEAVAIAVECKSTKLNWSDLSKWATSILQLKTSNESYTRIVSGINVGNDNKIDKPKAQTATRPILILCCLNKKALAKNSNLFDIIIRAPKAGNLQIDMGDKQSLQDWYMALNHADPSVSDNKHDGQEIKDIKISGYEVKKNNAVQSLLSLNLQLNQILMLINNPMWFPHKAYTDMFNHFGGD